MGFEAEHCNPRGSSLIQVLATDPPALAASYPNESIVNL